MPQTNACHKHTRTSALKASTSAAADDRCRTSTPRQVNIENYLDRGEAGSAKKYFLCKLLAMLLLAKPVRFTLFRTANAGICLKRNKGNVIILDVIF